MSTPLFDPDDPRLTAYALGEATPEERQAVELLLADSPEARATVEETRVLARRLEEDFARENAAYQQAHTTPVTAVNVVPFPAVPRRRWRPDVVLAWKLAAVFVAMGSLVWLVGRRTPLVPVASVQRAAPTQASSPAPVEHLEPAGNVDQSLAAAAPTKDAQTDMAKAEVHPAAPAAMAPPPAVSSQAPGSTEGLFAGASKPEARGGGLMLDKARQAPGQDRAASATLAAEAPRVAARLAPLPAAPRNAVTSSMQERLAAATVRIRFGDKTYAGGVLVTANGWLVAGPQSSKGMPTLDNITLADGRVVPVAAFASEPETGWALLRVDAGLLPYVPLAAEPPADGGRLFVARFDANTGALSFVDARALRRGQQSYISGADGAADLVFNEAGELLVVDRAAAFHATEAARARAKVSRRVAPVSVTVRPYTAAERDTFNRLTK